MIQHDGLWWPDSDVKGREYIVRDAKEAIPAVLEHVHGRTCAIQAGGNVGVYPLALAEHFEHVLTFEPEAGNYSCLMRNVFGSPHPVVSHLAALSDTSGSCDLSQSEYDNCGTFHVREGDSVQIRTIDEFVLPFCDLIWLDVEGHEFHALQGARRTIERLHPVIILERKAHEHNYGLEEDAMDWLLDYLGYREVMKLRNDHLYRWNVQ